MALSNSNHAATVKKNVLEQIVVFVRFKSGETELKGGKHVLLYRIETDIETNKR